MLCIFTVLPLSLPSWDDHWESRFYAYLRCFHSVCLLGMTSGKAYFMHIYGASAQLAFLGWPLGEHIYAYLLGFRSVCLLGITSGRADFMHIYGASAQFAFLG